MRRFFPVAFLLLTACHIHHAPGELEPPSPIFEQMMVCKSQIRVLERNLLNIDTPAYKQSQSFGWDGDVTTSFGVALSCRTDWSQGRLQRTGRNLDVAIDGVGFFQVILANGRTAYSRDGRLRINKSGRLTDVRGYPLMPKLTVPCDYIKLRILPSGQVVARTARAPDTTTNLGQLQIARFVSPDSLVSNAGVFEQTAAPGNPFVAIPGDQGLGLLRQGYLEMSNVNELATHARLRQLRQRHHRLASQVMASPSR